jgi:hypothetical protein
MAEKVAEAELEATQESETGKRPAVRPAVALAAKMAPQAPKDPAARAAKRVLSAFPLDWLALVSVRAFQRRNYYEFRFS